MYRHVWNKTKPAEFILKLRYGIFRYQSNSVVLCHFLPECASWLQRAWRVISNHRLNKSHGVLKNTWFFNVPGARLNAPSKRKKATSAMLMSLVWRGHRLSPTVVELLPKGLGIYIVVHKQNVLHTRWSQLSYQSTIYYCIVFPYLVFKNGMRRRSVLISF